MLAAIKELEDSLAFYRERKRNWIKSSKCVDLKSIRWFNEQISYRLELLCRLKGG